MQMGLDGLGVLDPTPFTDTVNGLVYLLRGKPEEAAVSFAGIIPFVGDAAKLGKRTKRLPDLFVGTHEEARAVIKQSGVNPNAYHAHHVIQNAVNYRVRNVEFKEGITIVLPREVHLKTQTYGRSARKLPSLRSHLAADIWELRRLLREAGYDSPVVNRALQELIQRNKALGGMERIRQQ